MARRRKHIPEHVKVQALLIILGFDPARAIDWNHRPALGLREYDEDTGLYTPDELDPRYLEPRYADNHDIITNGTKATVAGGDIHKIAKAKRLAKEHEEFRRRCLKREPGEPRQKSGKIRSRGFDKKHRPMNRRTA